jgi:hypothetical protein
MSYLIKKIHSFETIWEVFIQPAESSLIIHIKGSI